MHSDPTAAKTVTCGCGEVFKTKKPFYSKVEEEWIFPKAKGFDGYLEHYRGQVASAGLAVANRVHYIDLAI